MSKYDYLVVGAGLFGAVFAHEAALRGKHVKVIEKRDHIVLPVTFNVPVKRTSPLRSLA